ncbi:MAG: right-handed parallel beta-helix repeat-containing protein [Roseimicrobium sp.]
MNVRLPVFLVGLLSACVLSAQADVTANRYLSPQGTGTKEGSSRENAAAAVGDGLQKAWDALPADGTLWLLPGEYVGVTLDISASEDKATRTLAGEVAGDTRAVFVGDFDKARPEKTGGHIITIKEGASRWALKNLDFRNVNTAVHLLGSNEAGTIEGVRVYGAREGFRFEGKGKAKEVSKDITVQDCLFEHFTKRGVRMRPGHDSISVKRCRADAGGKEWATEPFHMGFAVEEGCDNITFTDCVARGSYNDADKGYWNGDGFCAESGAGTITWVRCRAFDNTDGGWDTKADLSVFVDCIALRNKRNIRIWGKATLENCLAAFPQYPKSTDGACVWSKGDVQMTRCTLVGSRPVECEDGGKVTLEKSYVVGLPKTDGERIAFPTEGTSLSNSEVVQSDAEGVKALLVAPEKGFKGGTGFNRKEGSGAVGYKHEKK